MAVNDTLVQRLYLIQLATATLPIGDVPTEMSAGCYLAQTNDGRNILIDSGLPADFMLPPEASSVKMGPNVVEQLSALGIAPRDVDTLISTHFDVDHAGYHDAFPGAKQIVQRKHYETAREDHPRYDAAREHWNHPALRYRMVEGDTELFPGLTLLETSGHAPGHQSVLIRLPLTGPVLLAIDAVAFERFNTPDRNAGPLDDDEEQLRASTSKLLDLAERKKVAFVVFGHDGAQWESLKKAPEWYD